MNTTPAIQHLLSLPPAMARGFRDCTGLQPPEWFAACDPPGAKLGSGGGVAQLLADAWNATGGGAPFEEWVKKSPKLLLMAGGMSRRLPAYAATGKLLLPMPVMRRAVGQSLDQTRPTCRCPPTGEFFRGDFPNSRRSSPAGMYCCGSPATCRRCPRWMCWAWACGCAPRLPAISAYFFRRATIRGNGPSSGKNPIPKKYWSWPGIIFILSIPACGCSGARAVAALMRRCGWNRDTESFGSGTASSFELYADFGLSLGQNPARFDPEISSLSCAVLPLPGAEFYHLGTSRQLIESASLLQNLQLDQTKLGGLAARPHPDQYILNSRFSDPRRQEQNRTLWVENSVVPKTWSLASDHVLTGIPDNQWPLRLEKGACLDIVPVGDLDFCVRPYGIDDAFRGAMGGDSTRWFGRPVSAWFPARGLDPAAAGIDPGMDIQQAPLFPVLSPEQMDSAFLQWMLDETPAEAPEMAELWRTAGRLSAEDLGVRANVGRLLAQRRRLCGEILPHLAENHRYNPFYRLDLERTADMFARAGHALPLEPGEGDPLVSVHDAMFRAAVLRKKGAQNWEDLEAVAFDRLRTAIIRQSQLEPVTPRRTIIEDQIIWGRSPVRIDLAGGWTDTPPYCLKHGGHVVNLAINLNGQPPIQVFARGCPEPVLVIRSIDLGVETRIATYAELDTFSRPGGGFALAKAALALAGFLPAFHRDGGAATLRQQLEAFGGGLEVSLLAAVPQGSGLGTSSILAATLLGVLGDFCGLGWDQAALSTRTLALEQMLTTGGGWQDQIGGITRGIKLIETTPGVEQKPSLRWLPDHLFSSAYANRSALLYYTGLTRLAKNILQEIVRGMFLNSSRHLDILGQMGEHALATYQALQSDNYEALCEAVARSWDLNQRLDAGTNTPGVQAILDAVGPHLAAAKLPGAGGGGYLFMLAKDESAARRIREILEATPPNDRARFVDFEISQLGLQITRS